MTIIQKRILLFFTALMLCGCGLHPAGVRPSVEITRIPPAGDGQQPDKLDIIQGRVNAAHPGQQIIVYAKRGATWWVQPLASLPFTNIESNSTWINTTRLGTEYATLLVEPGYQPPIKFNVLPTLGGGVAALATVPGATSGPVTSNFLRFSGYEWRIRNAPSGRGGTMNQYDPANAWADDGGALHLRIAKRDEQWTCAEVTLTQSFGYGTYSFVVRDTSHLESTAVLAMFTWDYAGGDKNNREMGIEISRWGEPASENMQYDVQPFYVAANVARLSAPGGTLTHSFRWEPGKVTFRTTRGSGNEVVGERAFTSGIPTPGTESVRMAFFVYSNPQAPVRNDNEVVIEKFEYLP